MSRLTRVLRRVATAAALCLLAGGLAACKESTTAAPATAIGNADRGRMLITKLGCGACHVIPGILEADGMVGPPLDHIARRQYLAGVLRNTPANMVTWVRHPQRIVPGNAMPDLAISETDGRDIAAYLATLR